MQITISVNDKKLIITKVSKVDSLIEKAIDNHDYQISRTILDALEIAFGEEKETVKCKDCEYLELELPYGVCSKAYKGIVRPDDTCPNGKRREK